MTTNNHNSENLHSQAEEGSTISNPNLSDKEQTKEINLIEKEGSSDSSDSSDLGADNPGNDETYQIEEQSISDKSDESDSPHLLNTEVFGKEVYDALPDFLQKCLAAFYLDREKDVFLIGAIGVISGVLQNLSGKYHRNHVYPNIAVFVTAPSSAGKNPLTLTRLLGADVHFHLRSNNLQAIQKYDSDLENYNKNKNKNPALIKPVKPVRLMLFIPANTSLSAIIKAMKENPHGCIIHTSEADSLIQALNQDWGGFSYVIRQGFHHETIERLRVADDVYDEIEQPRLSPVLAGTLRQMLGLIQDSEDGLFSRFAYYTFDLDQPWMDAFDQNLVIQDLPMFFKRRGKEVFDLYQEFQKLTIETEFVLTQSQVDLFNQSFKKWHNEFKYLLGKESISSVRRLGLICFRIGMILSAIRLMGQQIPSKLICNDQDFHTALRISEVLKNHAKVIFSLLPSEKGINLSKPRLRFYNALPNIFTYKQALAIGTKCGLKEGTSEKYLLKVFMPAGLVERVSHNNYKKK